MFKKATTSRAEILAADPLGEFFVWWDDLRAKDVSNFEGCLLAAKREQDLQSYLEASPLVLIQHLGGGHGRWVVPQKRLGAEHVTDFVIGEKSSDGYAWTAVELESPSSRMFTKAGDPTQALTHAIRQIQDWRTWLHRNQNYAARLRLEGGLGLTDITASIKGLILIGRRDNIDPITNERRRQMIQDLRIEIHSYDFLLESCEGRLQWTKSHRS